MEAWNSFLQTVFQFVKSLFTNVSKRMHRNAAVLTTGVAVVTVVAFTAGNFQGGGKNALVAFAETPGETDMGETDPEEIQAATEPETEQISAETLLQETAEPESETSETTETEDDTAAETEENVSAEPEHTETEDGAETSADETEAGPGTPGGENTGESAAGLEQVEVPPDAEEQERVVSCSADDYNVLLRIVQAEAGGCDIKGRILVANVVLNRVESDEFPDTITGVVYERSQFSPVIDGSINSCRVTEETVEAVDRALAGEDYSQGALYFMNRRTAAAKNVRWFDNHLEWLFQHGSHEFFK